MNFVSAKHYAIQKLSLLSCVSFITSFFVGVQNPVAFFVMVPLFRLQMKNTRIESFIFNIYIFVIYSQPIRDAAPLCLLVRTLRSLLMCERKYSGLFSAGLPNLKNRIQVLSYVLLHSPVGNEPITNPSFFDILQYLFWNHIMHLVQRKFVLFETFRTQAHLFFFTP